MRIKLKKRIQIGLIVRPPNWFRFFSGPTIWRIETNEKKLFLTFDDGPIPELTPWILDTLDEFNAKATFFCVGDNVRKFPELFKDIRARGHGAGNHSYSHLNGFRASIQSYSRDVYRARKYIDSKLFRPPYGRLRGFARRLLKARYKIILWDVLSMDYDQSLDPRQIVRNVVGNVKPGSIVVFHDNIKARENLEYALPRILDYYSKRGYSFVNLESELLGIRKQ
jgi:peptidoglycan/xylan/chitin deacetylase (PgdA/CDA1 family)